MSTRATRFPTVLLIGVLALLCACGPKASDDPSLTQLEAVARYLTSARHLRMSAYAGLHESNTPSELLSFLFSDIGVAEWPPSMDADAGEQAQMRATSTPMFPTDAALIYAQPNPRIGKQLVLKADDASGEIVAEAYLDPNRPPVSTERWAMPEFRE